MSARPCRKYAGHAGACSPNAYVECSRMRAGRELCGKPTDDESKLESREVRPPTPTPERLKELGIDRFKLLVIRRIESKFYEHDGVELKPYEKDES